MSPSEIIELIRDIAIIVVAAGVLLLLLVSIRMLRQLSSLIVSLLKTARAVEEISDSVSENVVKKATAGSGAAFGAGKVLSFLLGFRRKRGKQDGK